MTKEELVDELEDIIVQHRKPNTDFYYLFEDVKNLLRKANPDRYNQIFNEND